MIFRDLTLLIMGKWLSNGWGDRHYMPFKYLFKQDNVVFVMALRIEPIKAYFAPRTLGDLSMQ